MTYPTLAQSKITNVIIEFLTQKTGTVVQTVPAHSFLGQYKYLVSVTDSDNWMLLTKKLNNKNLLKLTTIITNQTLFTLDYIKEHSKELNKYNLN